jgi:hypothetical protein
MSNSIIYILYYDNESKLRAYEEYGGNSICKLIFVPTTIYFESFVIMELLLQRINEWKGCDYIGLISYKARAKCTIPINFSFLDNAKKRGYNIIFFMYAPSTFDYFNHGYKIHKNLEKIINILTDLVPLNLNETVPAYCNYWCMTPSVLYKYIIFLRHMKTIFENNADLSELLFEDAGYAKPPEHFSEVTGMEYYPHHPFVMERLTGVFSGDFKTIHYNEL